MELRIALCQCDIAWEQPARNLARLEPMVAAAEADVVLLPELFATGFTLDPAGVADGAGGAVVTGLRRWAAPIRQGGRRQRRRCRKRTFLQPDVFRETLGRIYRL